MPTQKLTAEIIAAAIDGYEFQKTRIDTRIAELRTMLSGGRAPPVTLEPKTRKRRISKAGMARIIAATKERWAKVRAAKAQQEKATRKAARKKAAVGKAAPVLFAMPYVAKSQKARVDELLNEWLAAMVSVRYSSA